MKDSAGPLIYTGPLIYNYSGCNAFLLAVIARTG